ncbi:MAG: 2-phospho-L-lactate guanylyltransferase [SAR202 cluster bacterium]|nr:2-phospho-L-lactate guanylyltransferase [SAR202 cluster bacterium]
MKGSYEGKRRLAQVLDAHSRAALCLVLLQHVLRTLAGTTTTVDTIVVGGDHWVRMLAAEESARWWADPGGRLNQAVETAVVRAFREGSAGVLVLPGDLGLLQSADVEQLINMSDGLKQLVLVRACRDGGTNAILIPSGQLVGLHFGHHSFAKHLQAAKRVNIAARIATPSSISFDLDTAHDLQTYRKRRPDFEETLASWRARVSSRELRRPLQV